MLIVTKKECICCGCNKKFFKYKVPIIHLLDATTVVPNPYLWGFITKKGNETFCLDCFTKKIRGDL